MKMGLRPLINLLDHNGAEPRRSKGSSTAGLRHRLPSDGKPSRDGLSKHVNKF